jgi:hypothetical protein
MRCGNDVDLGCLRMLVVPCGDLPRIFNLLELRCGAFLGFRLYRVHVLHGWVLQFGDGCRFVHRLFGRILHPSNGVFSIVKLLVVLVR